MKKRLSVGLFVYLLIGLFPPLASGEVMTNDSYTVKKNTVQIQPYIKDQPKPKEEIEKPYAQGQNYIVETTSPEAFSFGISTDNISFGPLQPTNPVLRRLTLLLGSNRGYQIFTTQDHALRTNEKTIIPDTTCDNGSCSSITPALWENTLTYGFGYHLDTMETAYFQHFPDSSRNEALYPIIQGLQARNQEFNVTYKVNIAGTQEAGTYSNTVTYIATPDF
jgi:hypothetical protein